MSETFRLPLDNSVGGDRLRAQDPFEKVTCGVCGKLLMRKTLILHSRSNLGHLNQLAEILAEERSALDESLRIEGRQRKPDPQEVARTIIGAIQSGVPPALGIDQMTVGRSGQLSALRALASSVKRGSRVRPLFVLGEYGTGKSHILNCAETLSFRENLLVFRVDIVNDRTSIRDGQGFRNALLNGIRFPELLSTRGRRDVMLRMALRRARVLAEQELKSRGTEVYGIETLKFFMEKGLEQGTTISTEDLGRSAIRYLDSGGEDVGEFSMEPIEQLDTISNFLASLSRDLGFDGAIALVDELEEESNIEAFQALTSFLRDPEKEIGWVFAATRDLLSRASAISDQTGHSLEARILEFSDELSPFTQRDYRELLDALVGFFDIAKGTRLRMSFDEQSVMSYVKKTVREEANMRSFIMMAVQDLVDASRGQGPFATRA